MCCLHTESYRENDHSAVIAAKNYSNVFLHFFFGFCFTLKQEYFKAIFLLIKIIILLLLLLPPLILTPHQCASTGGQYEATECIFCVRTAPNALNMNAMAYRIDRAATLQQRKTNKHTHTHKCMHKHVYIHTFIYVIKADCCRII